MMVVSVKRGTDTLWIGTPELLFEGDYVSGACCGHSYDVSLDGRRFVMIKAKPGSERHVTVELNALGRLE